MTVKERLEFSLCNTSRDENVVVRVCVYVASRWQRRKQTVAVVDGIPDDLESPLPAATVIQVFDGQ